VRLGANAGVYVQVGRDAFMVDALFDEHVHGFSALDETSFERFLDLADQNPPEAALFSHTHPDHFSQRACARAIARWPELFVAYPGASDSGSAFDMHGEGGAFHHGGIDVAYARVPHEGSCHFVPHYALRLEVGGIRILFSGDAHAGDPGVLALARSGVDIAILNFTWATLRSGRSVLDRFAPGAICLVHLPFEDDDRYGYRRSVEHVLHTFPFPHGLDIRALDAPFQSESFVIVN
jgi:glyoxylase-like metal-dependent hydrolase (beta-lactamase superfamily II)